MRKLTYFIACTADGFIARHDGSFDFFPTTGEHLPHIVSEYPETIPGHLHEMLGVQQGTRHFDTVLMGRATFEVGAEVGVVSPYPQLRQHLVSSTMAASPSTEVQLVRSDPVALVRELKQEAGQGIWLCGGARLAGALADEVDELILKVNPVILGAGIGLFGGVHRPMQLELLEHRTFAGGVAIHRYAVRRER
jgi:dihydrofolate reductase